MSKIVFILQPQPHPSRRLAAQALQSAPDGMVVRIEEAKRSDRQNELIQPLIREWTRKVEPILVNGEPTRLGMDDWRHILVAQYRKEAPRYALFEGGLILLGSSSKDLTKRECTEFVEFLHGLAGRKGFTLTRIETQEAA